MMKQLNVGRVDVALTNTIDGLLVLQQLGFGNIKPIDAPVAVLDLYHYLHQHHNDLVPKVDAAIKAMKENGEMDALIRRAENQIINSR